MSMHGSEVSDIPGPKSRPNTNKRLVWNRRLGLGVSGMNQEFMANLKNRRQRFKETYYLMLLWVKTIPCQNNGAAELGCQTRLPV